MFDFGLFLGALLALVIFALTAILIWKFLGMGGNIIEAVATTVQELLNRHKAGKLGSEIWKYAGASLLIILAMVLFVGLAAWVVRMMGVPSALGDTTAKVIKAILGFFHINIPLP